MTPTEKLELAIRRVVQRARADNTGPRAQELYDALWSVADELWKLERDEKDAKAGLPQSNS